MEESPKNEEYDDFVQSRDDSGQLLTVIERVKIERSRRMALVFVIVGTVVVVTVVFAVVLGVAIGVARRPGSTNVLPSDPHERAVAILTEYPLIDGYMITFNIHTC